MVLKEAMAKLYLNINQDTVEWKNSFFIEFCFGVSMQFVIHFGKCNE
jgi:hypothetical protein